MKTGYYSLLILFLSTLLFSACSPKQVRFVLVPDTQYYAEKFPEVMHSQADWIVKNAENIDLVIQQGDLTQNNNTEEWKVARAAFVKLDGKVPYVVGVGNHDMGSEPRKFADVRNTELFNTYFPYETMSQLPAFAGVMEQGKMDNAYYLLEAGGNKWMVLTLEFGPRNSVLEWANKIVAQYPDRTVILNTHSYMYSDSTRQGPGDSWRPQAYGIGKDSLENTVNDGEEIWRKFVKKHANIRFVFSGHVLNTGVGSLISVNEAGIPVYQFLANYQQGVRGQTENGGNGYLRIMDLDLRKNILRMKTYSPYLDDYKKEEAHDFTIKHVILD